MQELEELARRHAQEYFRVRRSSNPSGCYPSQQPPLGSPLPAETQTEEQLEETRIVETYKLLIFPENTFKEYLASLGVDELRKEFRKLAMLIHPDKNSHPHAKIAFQKLYNCFVEVSQSNN